MIFFVLLSEVHGLTGTLLDPVTESLLVTKDDEITLRENIDEEFVIISETLFELLRRNNRKLDATSEKNTLQLGAELNLIEATDNEDINNRMSLPHGAHIAQVRRHADKVNIFASFKIRLKFFDRIVGLQEYLDYIGMDRGMTIETVEFLFILTLGYEETKGFEVDEFATDSIDLLADITTELTDTKRGRLSRDRILDNKFFKYFDATFRSEKTGQQYHGKEVESINLKLGRTCLLVSRRGTKKYVKHCTLFLLKMQMRN